MTVSLRKIKPRATPQGTIWVCVDCMLIHANGETEGTPDREPWTLWEGTRSTDVTMGTLDHDCAEPDAGDCDCETRDFTWSDCDGCGSTLGGSRYAFTWWAQ